MGEETPGTRASSEGGNITEQGMELKEKLREARIKKGLSQQQLGEMVNVDRAQICHWEKGTHSPNYKSLIKLSKILRFKL